MEKIDVTNLKLLAQGGEALIYDLGEDKILRLMRNPNGKSFETENNLLQTLEEHQVSVPHVYETVEADGRHGEIMQKITGDTMILYFQKNPLKITEEIREFTALHLQVLEIPAGDGLHSIGDMVHYFMEKQPRENRDRDDFVRKIFESLPGGDTLCHGDFHPGNILMQGERCFIIDWTGAYRGNYLADVAHTYLLMKFVPQIPGQSAAQHEVVRRGGSHMAEVYFSEVRKHRKVDLSEFSRWTVVMAWLRAAYGVPSEKQTRIEYIEKCRESYEGGEDASQWWESL